MQQCKFLVNMKRILFFDLRVVNIVIRKADDSIYTRLFFLGQPVFVLFFLDNLVKFSKIDPVDRRFLEHGVFLLFFLLILMLFRKGWSLFFLFKLG
jgi:hypothetical protein